MVLLYYSIAQVQQSPKPMPPMNHYFDVTSQTFSRQNPPKYLLLKKPTMNSQLSLPTETTTVNNSPTTLTYAQPSLLLILELKAKHTEKGEYILYSMAWVVDVLSTYTKIGMVPSKPNNLLKVYLAANTTVSTTSMMHGQGYSKASLSS